MVGRGEGLNPLSPGGPVAASTPIRKALDEAARDDSIKAVVLRVDSPGGSAVASEIILQATKRVKNRKPLKNRRNDDTLVLSKGENGEWTPHDLRRTAATMMQALGVSLDVIDRCQNHVMPGSKVRSSLLTVTTTG